MKGCILKEFKGIGALELAELEVPKPQADEVQIEMKYAGVNPVDWKISEGYMDGVIEHQFPVVPGWDGAGVVTEVGSNVREFKPGDRVFGYFRSPVIHWGTYAEKSVIKASSLAKIPASMSFQVAASLPVVALTAWQALFEFANLQPGHVVLIEGASGGVGSMAVQFAHMKGATVIATSSKKNHDYVMSLGADWHIDYTTESVSDLVRGEYPEGVDIAMDCVGGPVTAQAAELTTDGGTFVSIVDRGAENRGAGRCKAGFIFVYPNGNELQEIAALYDKKIIKAPFIEEMPLSQAKEALSKVKRGHVVGKIVLKI